MAFGYESGYGTIPSDQTPQQPDQPSYGYQSGYGAGTDSAPSQQSPYSWSGLGQNALQDAGRQIVGAAKLGGIAAKSLWDVATGPSPISSPVAFAKNVLQTPESQAIQQMPGSVIQGVKDFVSDPVGAMYRNPVSTALIGGSVASGALPLAEKGGIKVMSAALGPSQEAIEARLANPEAIANASSYSDLAHQLPESLDTLKDQITQHSQDAFGTLRDSMDPSQGAIPKTQIHGMVRGLISDLKTSGALIGPARKAAVENLNSILEDINNIGGDPAGASNTSYLSESNLKDVIQSIDKNINWQDKGASETNSALTDFRGQLDQMLKGQNSNYAQAMQPVAEKLGLLNSLKKAFNITNQTGEGLQPTDTTISKIQSLPTERKSITQNLANQLDQATGQNYTQASKNYGYAKQFLGGSPNGSRRVASFGGIGTALGAGIGKLIGEPAAGAITGEALGGMAGLLADKYGGQIAGGIIDRYAPIADRISQLNASTPALAARRAALLAYLNGLNQNQNNAPGGQR